MNDGEDGVGYLGSGIAIMYEVDFFASWLSCNKSFILGVCVRGSMVIWRSLDCVLVMEESAYVGWFFLVLEAIVFCYPQIHECYGVNH